MLDFFINSAWAAPAQQEPGLASFLPLIILFAVFYFILIRPQMKQAKQHKQLVSELSKGDEVATSGGLLGKIKNVGDNFILLEIAKETEVKIQKNAVTTVLPKGTLKTL
ncbi:MAG: preprotein translocase subunit YajC [Proteobacteria bacterium]|nr:preprotein translocase subunit YajC [Pseudomonadota bacterium]NOG61404.1 preprotein translocase subunit YajC [Pseudomonadota bacterium]